MPHSTSRRLLACLLVLACAPIACAGSPEETMVAQKLAAAQLPREQVPESIRGHVTELLNQPVLHHCGPVEAFPCTPAVYDWLLDHPHWASRGWTAAGAKCAKIERHKDGTFHATQDGNGEVRWQTLVREPGLRIWYIEGSGRPAPFAPPVTLRGLLLLTYAPVRSTDGRAGVRHRTEMFAQFDGLGAGWLGKLWSDSADSVSRKTLEQVQLFFSGLAWYLCEKPTLCRTILKETPGRETDELEALLRELPNCPLSPKQAGRP